MANPLRIASRRSQLAMVQTNWVRDELIQQYGDITGEYLTRGLKKIITKSEMTDKPLKAYQKAILRDMESRK